MCPTSLVTLCLDDVRCLIGGTLLILIRVHVRMCVCVHVLSHDPCATGQRKVRSCQITSQTQYYMRTYLHGRQQSAVVSARGGAELS